MLTCMKHKITRIDHINIKHRDFMWIVVHFAWNDMHTLGRVHGKSFMTLNSGITRLQCHWSWQKNALCIAWNHLISSHCIASHRFTSHTKKTLHFLHHEYHRILLMDVCMFFFHQQTIQSLEKNTLAYTHEILFTLDKSGTFVCTHNINTIHISFMGFMHVCASDLWFHFGFYLNARVCLCTLQCPPY